MKFSCDKNVIVREISIAQEIISSRNALSILSNVLLEADNNVLTIKATDLKVGFETKIPVTVDESGDTTIFCDKFLGILRSMPDGVIEFEETENEKLYINSTSQDISFQLNSIGADKFPELPDVKEDNYFELPQKQFIEMISQTIFSISDDETRYFMNGVFLEKFDSRLIMVGTDGRRLSFIGSDTEAPEFSGVIIPPKILHLVKKLASGQGNLLLAVLDKVIFVKFDNQKLYSSIIDGQFPNYNKVIPEHQEYTAVVNKTAFLDGLKRVSILAEQKSKKIFATFQSGEIVLKSEESDIGTAKETLECSYEGPEMNIALNFMYLLEPIKVIDSENISIMFTEKNRAISIVSNPEGDFVHIVMPMQMD